jgi:hypothetical protein
VDTTNHEEIKMMNTSATNKMWTKIQKANPIWFSPESMKFWQSVVYFDTLAKHPDGYRFVSSEKNFDGTETLYTVRVATQRGIETLGEWQGYKTLKDAKEALPIL